MIWNNNNDDNDDDDSMWKKWEKNVNEWGEKQLIKWYIPNKWKGKQKKKKIEKHFKY